VSDRRHTVARGVVVLLAYVAVVGAACSATATPGASIDVHVSNATDIPIGVYIDGDWRGTDEPGATIVVPLGDGQPPIRVEARSPSGATLATLDAPPGPIEAMRGGDRSEVVGEAFGVPCGIITIVVGELDDGAAVAPATAVPAGPCP
jgi:hypothetical protein